MQQIGLTNYLIRMSSVHPWLEINGTAFQLRRKLLEIPSPHKPRQLSLDSRNLLLKPPLNKRSTCMISVLQTTCACFIVNLNKMKHQMIRVHHPTLLMMSILILVQTLKTQHPHPLSILVFLHMQQNNHFHQVIWDMFCLLPLVPKHRKSIQDISTTINNIYHPW